MYYLYSNTHERFLAGTDDLWVTLMSAKLFSSKMSLTICDLGSNAIIKDNYINWGLVDPSEAKQNQQIPSLMISKFGGEFKGTVLDISLNRLLDYQKTFLGVYNIINSAWITDALYNSVDQRLLMNLFDGNKFAAVDDDSGIDNGFLHTIYKIVYFSSSLEEMEIKILEIFNNKKSGRPTNLDLYKNAFYKFLNE